MTMDLVHVSMPLQILIFKDNDGVDGQNQITVRYLCGPGARPRHLQHTMYKVITEVVPQLPLK